MPNTVYPGYNRLLSDMSVLYKNHTFISDEVWKPLKVKAATGNNLKFDKTLYDITNTLRGVRQESVNADFGWTNDVYALNRHAFSTFVYDDEQDEADEDVDLGVTAMQFVKEKILLEQEYLSFGPSAPINQTGSSFNSGTTALDLTTPATDDWKSALNLGAISIETAAGVSPNMLVMNPDTMRAIVQTTQFQQSIQYVVPTIEIGGIMLPTNLLGLPVKYCQAISNTANDGQPVSNSRLMPNNIWMGYINPNPMQKYVLSYGARFWQKDIVTVDRSLDPRSNKYIDECYYQHKVIAPECGYVITCTLPSGY